MLPLTRHGTWEMVIGTVTLLVIGAGLSLVWWPLGLSVLPVIVWLFAFFRDPERAVPSTPHVMVSPADGMISDIGELPHNDLLGGPCLRIGIFLNVFNVHVNRAPCDGKISSVTYKKGKFINAMKHNEASDTNESNTITLAEPDGDRPVAVVKQIVGLIARRIVSAKQPGDTVAIGERIGMIKFGSRTELYIPMRLRPVAQVKVGQKVRGAMDIVATLSGATTADMASETRRAVAEVGGEEKVDVL